VDATVELNKPRARSQIPRTLQAELKRGRGYRVWGRAYEDGAALEGHVDAGAADLAAGTERRDHHLFALTPARCRPLPRRRRRRDGCHFFFERIS
jgi:hypothetical protein